jgi:hypothetical protein
VLYDFVIQPLNTYDAKTQKVFHNRCTLTK